MRKHKDIFTVHKDINKSKYNKVNRSIFPPDIQKNYDMRLTGWRRKIK